VQDACRNGDIAPKRAITAGRATLDILDFGIRALHRTAEPDKVFGHTFFKATEQAV